MHTAIIAMPADTEAGSGNRRAVALLQRVLLVVALAGVAWAVMSALAPGRASAHDCVAAYGPGAWSYPAPADHHHGHFCGVPAPDPVDPPVEEDPVDPPVDQDPEGLLPINGGGVSCSGGQHNHAYSPGWCHAAHTAANGDCRTHNSDGTHRAGTCPADPDPENLDPGQNQDQGTGCPGGQHNHAYSPDWCHSNHTAANGDCRTHNADGTHESNPCPGAGGGLSCQGGQHVHTYNDPDGWCHADHTEANNDCRTHNADGTHRAGTCSGNGLNLGAEGENDDPDTYNPGETASGRCGGGQTLDEESGLCRDWTEQELQGRVQCRRREGATHTSTFLADDPPGCPSGSVGPEVGLDDQFWVDVWNDRCAEQGLGPWDPVARECGGTGTFPCFDGETWVQVPSGTPCGASQCPVPGEPGNFIAGTNGMWDAETQTCGGGGDDDDTELCHDGIYRPAGSCPTPPPDHTPPPQEPRPANLMHCRASSAVRLSWGAVTVSSPAAGYALDGWQIEWGVSGSASTTVAALPAADREHERSLSTSSAWAVTLTPVLASGTVGTHSLSVHVPAGDPLSGQCPIPAPVPLAPTVTLVCDASEANGEFTSWTANTPAGWQRAVMYEIEWRHGTDPWQPTTGMHSGDLVNFVADADPGYEIEVRIRVRGRQREQIGGVWSAWSGWSAWSSWAEHNTPTCPFPAPPAPTVTLICGHTQFNGGFTPWGISDPLQAAEYEAQWRTVGSAAWTPIPLTANVVGRLEFDQSPPPHAERLEMQIRGRAHARRTSADPWSAWSAWSAWHHTTGPWCPPAPPPPPVSPTGPTPTADCLDVAGTLTGTVSWTPSADTTTRRYEHQVRWEYDRGGVGSGWQSVDPPAGASTITAGAGTLAAFDSVTAQTRIRSQARVEANGLWSLWSAWGAWGAWSNTSSPPGACPIPTTTIITTTQPCPPGSMRNPDHVADRETWYRRADTGTDLDADRQYEWPLSDLDTWRSGTGADLDDPPNGLQPDEWHTAASLRNILQRDREQLNSVRAADSTLTTAQAITAAAEGDVGCYPPGHRCLAPGVRCIRTGS